MKKRRMTIQILSAMLASAMICTSVPVPAFAQEIFDSGEQNELFTEEPGNERAAGTEEFSSDEADAEFQAGEESEEENEGIRYIKGRPLTEEEREEQLEPFKNLTPLDPGPQVESDLYSDISVYSRAAEYLSKYDAREKGLVTTVKNQNPFGTCWAFGMAAVMEASLLFQGQGTYDLSEEHLSYFFSNRQNDPLGNTADDINTVAGNYHNIGGNDYLAAVFLSTWSGMTTEDDVPLPTDSLHKQDLTAEISADKAYNAAVYLKNASFSNYSVKDNDELEGSKNRMKKLLMKDHAVSIMFYMAENYVNPDTAAYCYPTTATSKVINHIVTVVGWDDDYDKNNFLDASMVQNNGAWIVKNSWGEDKGDQGYYYVSYEDPNISNLVSAEAVTTSQQIYKNNYFYDGSSAISSVKIQPGQSVAAAYEAKAGNGKEEAIGEVNVVTMTDNASYKIQIYTDITDPADPQSGTPAYAQPYEVEQEIAGVHTVTVPEVVLKQGSRYSVVITNSGSSYISFGVETSTSYNNSGGGSWFTSTAGIEQNQTFYKGALPTSEWRDGKIANWSVRIKVHTRTLDQSWIPDTPVFQVKAYNSGYNLVSWDKVSNAAGYYIYRRPSSGGGWSKIAAVKNSSLKYKDSRITAGTSYRYTVRAYYQANGKNYLSKYTTGPIIKAAPALQSISSVKSEKNGIRILWKKQKCDGYYIYRKKKDGSYQLIRKISDKNTVSYLDKKAVKGVSYYYAVRAYVRETYGNVYSKYKRSSVIKRK